MRRESLQEMLGQLTDQLAEMGGEVRRALDHATTALLDSRPRLAVQVIEADRLIDGMRARVEEVATEALLFHAPVAGELRAVVFAIQSGHELERMGDLARHVAEAAERAGSGSVVSALARPLFVELGSVTDAMAGKAVEVLRTRNVILATELDDDDNRVDELHKELFALLMGPTWDGGVSGAVDLTLLARFYERYADHAVSLAHRTVFAVTGSHVDALDL